MVTTTTTLPTSAPGDVANPVGLIGRAAEQADMGRIACSPRPDSSSVIARHPADHGRKLL